MFEDCGVYTDQGSRNGDGGLRIDNRGSRSASDERVINPNVRLSLFFVTAFRNALLHRKQILLRHDAQDLLSSHVK